MNSKYIFPVIVAGVLLVTGGYISTRSNISNSATANPKSAQDLVTLSGTYTCLPLLNATLPSNDCAFGIKTDTGEYYAINFGASAGSMADFKAQVHITAKGMLIERAQLHPNSWEKFDMKGLFTIMEHPIQ